MRTAGADGRKSDKDTPAPIKDGLASLGLENQKKPLKREAQS